MEWQSAQLPKRDGISRTLEAASGVGLSKRLRRRRQRLVRGAVFDNVGSTVPQTGRPAGSQHCQGGTRGERAGEKSRRSVESTAIRKRIERRDDDEDCPGRAGAPVTSDERPGTVDHSRAIPNTPTKTPAAWAGASNSGRSSRVTVRLPAVPARRTEWTLLEQRHWAALDRQSGSPSGPCCGRRRRPRWPRTACRGHPCHSGRRRLR